MIDPPLTGHSIARLIRMRKRDLGHRNDPASLLFFTTFGVHFVAYERKWSEGNLTKVFHVGHDQPIKSLGYTPAGHKAYIIRIDAERDWGIEKIAIRF
jgi:hypothetical protein